MAIKYITKPPATSALNASVIELPANYTLGASHELANQSSDAVIAEKLHLIQSTTSDSSKAGPLYNVGTATAHPMLACALNYAGRGWPVMLAKPNTKDSYFGDKVGLAMLDQTAIQAAFTAQPNANVAVVPGLKAGVVVLDVDVKNGKPGQMVLAALESFFGPMDTLTCSTPSGGRHLYFKHAGTPLKRKEILPGVELYAEAKLMAPPSIVSGKAYQWIDESKPVAESPAWLAKMLTYAADGALCQVIDLLSKHWNQASSRQYLCLAVAGFLARRGWSLEKTLLAVRVIHTVANDDKDDLDKRLHAVKDTYEKVETNEAKPPAQRQPLTGLPQIGKELGEQVASTLMKLVGGKAHADTDELCETEIEKLNAEYAVVCAGSSVVILRETVDPSSNEPTIQLMRSADFGLWKRNETIDGDRVTDLWLENPKRRQYEGIIFAPGSSPSGFYNLWKGFPIQAAPGDCSKFLQHIEKVICRGDAVVFAYVLNWCAHLLQCPADLPEIALVLRGLQGIGKGKFARTLGRLVGAAHFSHLTSMTQIVGRFNRHLAGKLLVYADEALWGGNRQSDGPLKALVTEPTIAIESKGKDIFSVRNYTRLIAASNATWAVPLDLDDRRFLVLDVSDNHKEDYGYFAAIDAELNNGGLAALMQFLLERDLSNFNVRAMPKTSFGFDIKLKSAGPVGQWWHEKLFNADPGHWTVAVEKDALHAEYLEWGKAHHVQHPEPKELFTRELRKFVPHLKDSRPASSHSWSCRPRSYKLGALPACRIAFQELCKCGPEIWQG